MMRLGRTARRVCWALAFAALVGIFAVAGRGDGQPPTAAERVETLARQFACPECAGQSVASSNAPAAQNIRGALAEMIAEGSTDAEIRTRITDRFGEEVSLVPASSGLVGLVWVIPVVVVVVALAALMATMVRWRRSIGHGDRASDADRALVEQFLNERAELTDTDSPVAAAPGSAAERGPAR
jgi:cytochrome c-type biogenesis protein CcmH